MKTRIICCLIAVFASFSFTNFQETIPSKQSSSGEPLSTVIEEGGTGPFKAILTEDPNLKGFTIYRPLNLNVFGEKQKLPIILWGNGGCMNTSFPFRNFLNEIASNGYLVIAIGPYETALSMSNMELGRQSTKSSQLIDALNWIIEQNSNKTSIYLNKIDVKKVAVMGQSCGGLQAIEVSSDPRITTTVVCNSGVLNAGPASGPFPGMPSVSKEMLQQYNGPVMYLLGGKEDIAYTNGTDDFSRITKIPAVMMSQEVGHGGTYSQPHGGTFAVAALAWLNWQLKGDMNSSKMIIGNDCGLCNDPLWTIETKNFNN
jgi:dienelactone hydrolase